MSDEPRATVREIDGQLVLDDPDAVEMIRAVGKHNCEQTFKDNIDRVEHFMSRINQLGKSPSEIVIVIINVDDPYGQPIAEALMPGHDWQSYRDQGQIPFARGLAERSGIEDIVETFDKEAADALRARPNQFCTVVVDHGVAEVFKQGEQNG